MFAGGTELLSRLCAGIPASSLWGPGGTEAPRVSWIKEMVQDLELLHVWGWGHKGELGAPGAGKECL